MRRVAVPPRPDWRRRVEALGFVTHSPEEAGASYWTEDAAWVFTEAEIDALEAATAELHRLCLAAVEHVVATPGLLRRFAVPDWAEAMVARSWRRARALGPGDPTLMGRFDLAFDGHGTKLIEYNADCPAMLVESSIVQWDWLREAMPDAAAEERQFNILHDHLVERLGELRALTGEAVLHLASEQHILEEHVQVEYLREIAAEAGFRATVHLDMAEIGLEQGPGGVRLVDLEGRPIRLLHKMYPWEWLLREEVGPHLPALHEAAVFLEPAWKVVLSSKALLPVLWQLFPGHPLLLPAFFEPHPSLGGDYAVKPVVGWEGKGVEIRRGGTVVARREAGPFDGESPVYQALADLEVEPGRFVQVGSWMVGSRPSGILVREDAGPIIGTTSPVLPHFWEG